MADLGIAALSICLGQIKSLEVASNAITHVDLESLSTALMMEEIIVCVIFACSLVCSVKVVCASCRCFHSDASTATLDTKLLLKARCTQGRI